MYYTSLATCGIAFAALQSLLPAPTVYYCRVAGRIMFQNVGVGPMYKSSVRFKSKHHSALQTNLSDVLGHETGTLHLNSISPNWMDEYWEGMAIFPADDDPSLDWSRNIQWLLKKQQVTAVVTYNYFDFWPFSSVCEIPL